MAKKMLDQGHTVIYYENIEGGHSAAANLKQSAYMTTLQLEYLKEKLL
jgi:prolyl oligopeptidase